MKKLIVIAMVMVMALTASAAMAQVDTQWTILMKAGTISGYNGTGALPTGTVTWLNTFGAATMSVTSVATTAVSASPFAATASGIDFGVAADPTKRIVTIKQQYAPAIAEYTWFATLETGSSHATADVALAYWVPATGENFTGWTIKAYKKVAGEWVQQGTNLVEPTVFNGSGNSGSAKIIAYQQGLGANVSQEWKFVATAVPEPGSMVALFSGLVGLVGFGIRRRK